VANPGRGHDGLRSIVGELSASSPRCWASCCTHHWQIFLPKVKPGSWRPHRMQFAMESKEYQQFGVK
jgi:hypothetical protein